jgi:hypothetical protein
MDRPRSARTNKPEEAMTLIARQATHLTAAYREAKGVVVDVLASFARTC